jgi:sugar lactone lactonase YvrE
MSAFKHKCATGGSPRSHDMRNVLGSVLILTPGGWGNNLCPERLIRSNGLCWAPANRWLRHPEVDESMSGQHPVRNACSWRDTMT